MNYISQADIESYFGYSLTANGVGTFNATLPGLQAVVDDYCNRSWNITNPITENFDAFDANGRPNDTFFVKYPQIDTITSLTIGGNLWDPAYVYNYKTHVKIYIKPYVILMPNPLGYQQIQLIYSSLAAGAVPPAVKQAMIEWMARKIQTAQDSNKDTTQVSAGTVKVNYRQDAQGGIPDFVSMVLDRYRLTPLDHF